LVYIGEEGGVVDCPPGIKWGAGLGKKKKGNGREIGQLAERGEVRDKSGESY
jgi:hypothetical protein